MVKKWFIWCVLIFVASSFASESGVLSNRAKRSLEVGKFAKSYRQLERALLASRKEADLHAEARVLIAMAQIRIMSLDLDFADSLLAIAHPEVMNQNTRAMYLQEKIALENARGTYDKALKICSSYPEDSLKKADAPLQAAFYSDCAIAFAGKNDFETAHSYLQKVGKKSDTESGFYAFTAAQIEDKKSSGIADSLYQIAEKKSIERNYPYMTATILYYRSLLPNAKDKDELKLRCKNAFELMGLPNNSKRCE